MKGLVICQQLIPAWLEGRKTVTRRLMNPQPQYQWADGKPAFMQAEHTPKPRYRPGETVYIKESCYICGSDSDGAPLAEPPVVYRADGAMKSDEYPHFRSSLFMPEWAARKEGGHALIVSVRPEQLFGMTGVEARLEGFESLDEFIEL